MCSFLYLLCANTTQKQWTVVAQLYTFNRLSFINTPDKIASLVAGALRRCSDRTDVRETCVHVCMCVYE